MSNEKIDTLNKAAEAMREKIENNIAEFREMPLAQTLTTTKGDSAVKANPAVQEFRALVKDYATTLKALRDIQGEQSEKAEINNLENIRAKFKVAK